MLFIYNHQRDLFLNFYTKYLSQRVIYQKKFSYDDEIKMITSFKQQAGNQAVNKMNIMLTDYQISFDLSQRFSEIIK